MLSDQVFAWATDAERNKPYIKGFSRYAFGRWKGDLVTGESPGMAQSERLKYCERVSLVSALPYSSRPHFSSPKLKLATPRRMIATGYDTIHTLTLFSSSGRIFGSDPVPTSVAHLPCKTVPLLSSDAILHSQPMRRRYSRMRTGT